MYKKDLHDCPLGVLGIIISAVLLVSPFLFTQLRSNSIYTASLLFTFSHKPSNSYMTKLPVFCDTMFQ